MLNVGLVDEVAVHDDAVSPSLNGIAAHGNDALDDEKPVFVADDHISILRGTEPKGAGINNDVVPALDGRFHRRRWNGEISESRGACHPCEGQANDDDGHRQSEEEPHLGGSAPCFMIPQELGAASGVEAQNEPAQR